MTRSIMDWTAIPPRWLTVGVSVMLLLVFSAAANVSIFRVFTAGRDHFTESIAVAWQAAYMRRLRDKLRNSNSRGRGAQATIARILQEAEFRDLKRSTRHRKKCK